MYGLLIVTGILCASFLAEKRAKQNNLSTNILWDGLFIMFGFGILGARIYHVIDYWNIYSQNPIQIFYVWQGGLGIFGGMFLGLLALVVFLHLKKQNILVWLDLIVSVMPLAQAIGRIANVVNNELIPFAYFAIVFNFVLFLCLYILYKPLKSKPGTLTSIYLIAYSLIRIILEPLRPNTSLNLYGVNMTIFISVLIIIVVTFIYGINYIRSRRV